ncbi:MAG: hypothetical protein AUK47_12320 [Deltaproteobacteria bacterium CG2_30_63_29]|nr:MAG: hypothetical protein AUK47_12320 [Deltaproteobacteria bacterium CG2_30_63_29]PJB38812.1 MAG: hypothetical protein CO108_18375 [Deltaproteobacteria bacterium CG_4_9_14_3_um_filter_63_12]
MARPLEGLRVLDFSRVLSGPYGTMTLADLGADVIKVEHPAEGDDTRKFGPPFVDNQSTYFLSINRGKRSVALDLKNPEDLLSALKLVDKADVVVENFRPGVMDRLGLSPEVLRARNPRLVYCSISGFGRCANKPGYDLMIQGLSGIPSLTGPPEGEPYKCGASIADLVAGMNAVQGILAALLRRERTGEGAFVDVSMLDGQLSLLTYHASAWLNGDSEPQRLGNAHPSIHPFRTFQCADGYLNLAIGNDSLWRRFLDLLGDLGVPAYAALLSERFSTNPGRVAAREELNGLLEPVFLSRRTDDWLELLRAARLPSGPMATIAEALQSADLVAHEHPATGKAIRTITLPYRIDDLPRAAERRAPLLGEHQDEVFADWLGDAE